MTQPLPILHASEPSPRPTLLHVSPPAVIYPPVEECEREDLLKIAGRPLWEVMGSSQHVDAILQLALVQAREAVAADRQIRDLQRQLAIQQGIVTSHQNALEREQAAVAVHAQLVADERDQRRELQEQLDSADAHVARLRRASTVTAQFSCLSIVSVSGPTYKAAGREVERQVAAHPVFDVSDVPR
jgi:hypothetical protein